MDYSIESARIGDIAEIMRLEAACFEPGVRETLDCFMDRLSAFPDGFTVLAPSRPAGESRPLAGYFCSELWGAVPPAQADCWMLGHSAKERHDDAGKVLYISSFAVDPTARGNGRALFNASIALILARRPAISRIAFIVHERWAAARHIYETTGFTYTGRIGDFFSPDGAALIMEKEL